MSRARAFIAVAVIGLLAHWWRREDPFVKRYGYNPAREPWDIYS